jgi:hypothetical protein
VRFDEPHLHLRVFLASPGDVEDERTAARVLMESTLPYDPLLPYNVSFHVIAYDHPSASTPMPAHLTPQEAVTRFKGRPAECDIVLVILRNGMGTVLDMSRLRKPDGSPYLSGTEWEYEDARNASPAPEIMVFHCSTATSVAPEVAAFLGRFRNADGSWNGGVNEFKDTADFRFKLEVYLKHIIRERAIGRSFKPIMLPNQSLDTVSNDTPSLRRLEEISEKYSRLFESNHDIPEFILPGLMRDVIKQMPSSEEYEYSLLTFKQLNEDLSRSVLDNPLRFRHFSQQSRDNLTRVISSDELTRLINVSPSDIVGSAWHGQVDPSVLYKLRNASHHIGRPIRINVASCLVGACAAVWWMALEGAPIEVTTTDAAGREQALRLRRDGDVAPDFVIAADAPMFLEKHNRISRFSKLLDVHTEFQTLLVKRGEASGRPRAIFLYPNSSALLQLKHQYQQLKRRYQIDAATPEVALELVDYLRISRIMQPGDLIFAWQPLLDRLIEDPGFMVDHRAKFLLTVSLYQNSDRFSADLSVANSAFVDYFVAAWNRADANRLLAWLIVLTKDGFLSDFGRSVVRKTRYKAR